MVTTDDIQGHWQRIWLRAPGLEDTTTRVHWMQAGDVYADLRIPLHRPDIRGATALSDLSDAALALLLTAEGFAGTTHVADSVCTWTRHINWHGATATIDAGRLSFQPDGDLIEDGVHADYAELWTRPSSDVASGQVLRGAGLTGYLVTVGDHFVFGLGDPSAPEMQTDPWPDRRHLAAFFDHVHLSGHWDGTEGVVDLATNPFLEDRVCLSRQADGVAFHHQSFDGSYRQIALTDAAAKAPCA